MVNTRRGQVSLEYLMTYGIAIAIVVIAIAALYSMGVFNPSSSTVACSPCFANFAFVDYADGTLIVKNGPRALTNVYCNITTGTCNVKGGATANIAANEQFNITISDITTNDVPINLTYSDKLSTLTHSDIGTIHN